MPAGRDFHTAVWTGSDMIVWGGASATPGSFFDSGGVFTPPGTDFYTVYPCRVLDSRQATGPWGGQPLAAGQERALAVAGTCGVPATAAALSFNLTVTAGTAPGNIRLYPAGSPRVLSSVLNFASGQTCSNNGVVTLGAEGNLEVFSGQTSGRVHVILDVSGYFE